MYEGVVRSRGLEGTGSHRCFNSIAFELVAGGKLFSEFLDLGNGEFVPAKFFFKIIFGHVLIKINFSALVVLLEICQLTVFPDPTQVIVLLSLLLPIYLQPLKRFDLFQLNLFSVLAWLLLPDLHILVFAAEKHPSAVIVDPALRKKY